MKNPDHASQDDPTLSAPLFTVEARNASIVALTLLWHPDLKRAGQQAPITAIGQPVPIHRSAPLFRHPDMDEGMPLAHPCISRAPLLLTVLADGQVQLHLPASRMRCEINGRTSTGETVLLSRDAVDDGAVLQLGSSVVLCIHRITTLPHRANDLGLVGISSHVTRIRRLIDQVARTDLPVLILGESGTGKELVAQAVHARSARQRKPMVSVNMAAMGESLAMADLFGSMRGAYTGAQSSRKGLFAEADGGTLFLDEIGDTPAVVQPMLLRAIETGEYRPLGSSQTEHADVRLIAATDRDLSVGGFNRPLLRRLEAFLIHTPPLRRRREDIGVLIRHMLHSADEDSTLLASVPPILVRAICLHDWPGNVRQLGHAVRRLVLASTSGHWPSVEELLGLAPAPAMSNSPLPPQAPDEAEASAGADTAPPPPPDKPAKRYRAPAEVTEDDLIAALESADWQLLEAARSLGVSRPSLYNLLKRNTTVRRAESITRDEIHATVAHIGTSDLATLASRLRTPREALRRHLRALGFTE